MKFDLAFCYPGGWRDNRASMGRAGCKCFMSKVIYKVIRKLSKCEEGGIVRVRWQSELLAY